MATLDDYMEEFEQLGEVEVRRRMLAETYGKPNVALRLAAEDWLRQKAEAHAKTNKMEEIAVAHRTAEAAERSAAAAETASRDATVSKCAAIAAVLIMALSLIVHLFK